MLQLLVNEGFVFPRLSSTPAQQFFLGLIILLFCLLAPLACEPDVYRNALTVNYSVSTQETVWKETVVQALLLQCHKAL